MPHHFRLNVAALIPQSVTPAALMLSSLFQNKGGLFVLDNEDHFPHITFYSSDFSEENLEAIRDEIERVLSLHEAPAFTSIGFHQKSDGFVDIGFQKTAEIDRLHRALAGALVSMHGDAAHRERWAEFSPTEQENIIRWGYPEAADLYRPHLTLTRLREGARGSNAIEFLPETKLHFHAEEFSLFLAGPNGTGKEPLGIFRFGKKPVIA